MWGHVWGLELMQYRHVGSTFSVARDEPSLVDLVSTLGSTCKLEKVLPRRQW